VTAQASPDRRTVLLIVHTGRAEAVEVAVAVSKQLMASGMTMRLLDVDAPSLDIGAAEVAPPGSAAASGCEIALVIGGDGTILRAAELTRLTETPLLGINLGHVGFLAEAEWDDLETTVEAIIARSYVVEDRLTVDVSVIIDGAVTWTGWALNEVSVEKAARQRMLDVVVEIDDRPLSRWGCDGVVFATPTGSTAYAFSAGGPVVWPGVEALLLVPISAHALFSRPMVTSPDSTLAIELQPETDGGVLWCDGRRQVDLGPNGRVEVTRGAHPVRLARLHEAPFTDRLVAKFDLPVAGWRGAARRRREARAGGDDA
jgi:NAD+ kinase